MGVALGELVGCQQASAQLGRTGAAWSPCPPHLSLLPPQRGVWSWEDGEHQEGHPVPGPRGIVSQGQEGARCPCKPFSLGTPQTCLQLHPLSAALHTHSWCRVPFLPVLPEHLLCAHHGIRSKQVGEMRLVLSLVGSGIVWVHSRGFCLSPGCRWSVSGFGGLESVPSL